MRAVIGETAPNLKLSEWVQGRPTNIDREAGRIVLVEVFQVNCPGCFLYALPEAAGIHEQYHDKGVTVIGVATAFEDFDKNTLDNLRRLSEMGYVVGETKRALTEAGRVGDGGFDAGGLEDAGGGECVEGACGHVARVFMSRVSSSAIPPGVHGPGG